MHNRNIIFILENYTFDIWKCLYKATVLEWLFQIKYKVGSAMHTQKHGLKMV